MWSIFRSLICRSYFYYRSGRRIIFSTRSAGFHAIKKDNSPHWQSWGCQTKKQSLVWEWNLYLKLQRPKRLCIRSKIKPHKCNRSFRLVKNWHIIRLTLKALKPYLRSRKISITLANEHTSHSRCTHNYYSSSEICTQRYNHSSSSSEVKANIVGRLYWWVCGIQEEKLCSLMSE